MMIANETHIFDLHCHTAYSDGSLSPKELVAHMFQCGVNTLAITDHDSVAGIPEAKTAVEALDMSLVSGVEISCIWKGIEIHILGLNINTDSPRLHELLDAQKTRRWERARNIALALENVGVPGALGFVSTLNKDSSPGRIHFANFLQEQGLVKNHEKAFKKYLGKGNAAYVAPDWVGAEEAIEVIHHAGGSSVLAHPSKYRLNRARQRKLIRDFASVGGLGIEVISGQMGINEIIYLARISQELGLYASTGSDFHQKEQLWLKPGELPELPAKCKPVWDLWFQADTGK